MEHQFAENLQFDGVEIHEIQQLAIADDLQQLPAENIVVNIQDGNLDVPRADAA